MFALLRSSRSSTGWLRLSGAGEILTAMCPEEVRPLIRRVEAEAAAGKWLAGWLSYEAATAFEPTIPVHLSPGPLAVFGIFEQAEEVKLEELELSEKSGRGLGEPGATGSPSRSEATPNHKGFGGEPPSGVRGGSPGFTPLPTWVPLVDAKTQQQALTELKAAIFAGELYQANLSFRCAVELGDAPSHKGFGGEPQSGVRGGSPAPLGSFALALFRRLYQAQPVPFAALIELGPHCLISLSPELFLERSGQTLLSRPMKGTCARAASWNDDEERRRWLAGDPKSQAENVMIVDLMRNDLSRICRQNSVQVDSLFQVDRYTTLHQMVSQVSGQLLPETSLEDILAATFPPGSVTGAPKIQACHLIHRLESTPRGAYTGIAGLIEPGGDFTFNVCIRTLEKQASGWSLGLGSGVVADSSTSLEWEECLLKGAFLRAEALPEEVFTTLRWQDGKPIGLLPHLRRLRDSCRWFQRPFPSEAIFAQVRQWRKDSFCPPLISKMASSSSPALDPSWVAHASPGSPRPWVGSEKEFRPLAGRTALDPTLCDPMRVGELGNLQPRVIADAARPWASMCDPQGVEQPNPTECSDRKFFSAELPNITRAFRIRLAVSPSGLLSCRSEPLAVSGWGKDEAVVVIADEKVRSSDPWLRHKTSRRGIYDRALAAAKASGADEALIFNERDELAEGSFTSVFLRDSKGQWHTPPLAAGILPGIWRQEQIHLLGAIERPLLLRDLLNAAEIRIGNSLRGGVSARIRA